VDDPAQNRAGCSLPERLDPVARGPPNAEGPAAPDRFSEAAWDLLCFSAGRQPAGWRHARSMWNTCAGAGSGIHRYRPVGGTTLPIEAIRLLDQLEGFAPTPSGQRRGAFSR